MTGKLIDFLDEGVFVVQAEDGNEYDVNPQEIMGVMQQSAPVASI